MHLCILVFFENMRDILSYQHSVHSFILEEFNIIFCLLISSYSFNFISVDISFISFLDALINVLVIEIQQYHSSHFVIKCS